MHDHQTQVPWGQSLRTPTEPLGAWLSMLGEIVLTTDQLAVEQLD